MSGLNAPQQMPVRQRSFDEDEAVIDDQDASETTKLFNERLQAWKHACGYLEDYISATEKMHRDSQKEYERVLKTVSSPLREGHHFDQQMGGVAEIFENIRVNTQGLGNSNVETAKQLKNAVLPVFERLHSEIKSKQKELSKGVGKGSKAVDKARGLTQKHIEKLGTQTAAHGPLSNPKADPYNDPFVIHKGIFHLLNKQILEENATKNDMVAVQNNFSSFEAHVVQTFQQGLGHLMTTLSAHYDGEKQMYTNMVGKAQAMDPLFEWNHFVQRKSDLLIDPNAPERTIDSIAFPNKGHSLTQPLLQGRLERRSGLIKSWSAAFYAISPAGFLHEFKTDDHIGHEPKPETSLYLPDCTMGGLNGGEFALKGKDKSSTLATKSEYKFRAASPAEAEKWYEAIQSLASGKSQPGSELTSPTSPAGSRNVSGASAFSEFPPAGQAQAHSAASPSSATSGGYGGLGSPTMSHGPQETGTTGGPPPGSAFGDASQSGIGGKPGEY